MLPSLLVGYSRGRLQTSFRPSPPILTWESHGVPPLQTTPNIHPYCTSPPTVPSCGRWSLATVRSAPTRGSDTHRLDEHPGDLDEHERCHTVIFDIRTQVLYPSYI